MEKLNRLKGSVVDFVTDDLNIADAASNPEVQKWYNEVIKTRFSGKTLPGIVSGRMENTISGSLTARNKEKSIKAEYLTRDHAIQHMKDITGYPCYMHSGCYYLDGSFEVTATSSHPHFVDVTFVFTPNRILKTHY